MLRAYQKKNPTKDFISSWGSFFYLLIAYFISFSSTSAMWWYGLRSKRVSVCFANSVFPDFFALKAKSKVKSTLAFCFHVPCT
jgi:hypothetical protein